MNARDGLRGYLDAVGNAPMVTVPATWLRELLAGDETPLVDRDCAAVAALLGRKPSTIRAWAAQGRFPGAYRLHDREWRFPIEAIRGFRPQSDRDPDPAGPAAMKLAKRAVDIGGWRDELRTDHAA